MSNDKHTIKSYNQGFFTETKRFIFTLTHDMSKSLSSSYIKYLFILIVSFYQIAYFPFELRVFLI